MIWLSFCVCEINLFQVRNFRFYRSITLGRRAVCITKELEKQLIESFGEMGRVKPMEYFASMDIRCFGF